MCGHCKIDFIFMFCVMGFQYRTVDHGFRYIIGNEFCPDLLFNILWFIGMEIAQAYGIFQLSERRFNPPSGIVQRLDTFRREFITRQVRNETFIRRLLEMESYNPKRKFIGVITAVRDVIKSSRLIHKALVSAGIDRNFS